MEGADMSKYAVVILLSCGMTIIINTYIIIKTSTSTIKTIWASLFMLIGMMLFFWGLGETMVKFLDYLSKAITMAITMSKFNPVK
jgi:hypothetical protein